MPNWRAAATAAPATTENSTAPYTDQIRRSDPQAALDTAARAILGACFHNSVRPDPATGEVAQRRYADELSDMAIAYLLTPGRRDTTHA
ncbi:MULTISPECIES: hypothetical protein [unclassified Streptomyces]|uniref:hypothetical protein n=1 Tax=unclassified Streptomyces TaxID=2593676 RepID=UPI0033A76EFB